EPLGPEGIVWSRWLDVAAEELLKFQVEAAPQGLKLTWRLYEAATQRQTTSGTLEGRVADARRLAHRLADEMVRHHTREPGAFSTRIAFVRRPKGGLEGDLGFRLRREERQPRPPYPGHLPAAHLVAFGRRA